jgi:hypothetical protein
MACSEMPEGVMLLKSGRLYAVEKDEEDYQYICRYQVIWGK